MNYDSFYVGLILERCYRLLPNPIRGKYSLVFQAENFNAEEAEQRIVIVKILCTDLQGPASAKLATKLEGYFALEIESLACACHPNVIRLINSGSAQDNTGRFFRYQILEFMPGGTLEDLCWQRRLRIDEAIDYLSQAVLALQYIHRLKPAIIHRDIKPENFLLTSDFKTLKLADFGVARLDDDVGSITFVGAVTYAAPEHHPLLRRNSSGQLTPATDVYSLGKTFYRLVAGERPEEFGGQPITEWPTSVAQEPWADDLIKVIYKATQDDPRRRHQSPAEFLRDVRKAVESFKPKYYSKQATKPVPSGSSTKSAKNIIIGQTRPSYLLVRMLLTAMLIMLILTVALITIKRPADKQIQAASNNFQTKTGPTLDSLPQNRATLDGRMVAPFDNIDVNLHEEAGVSQKIICVINNKAQVKTLIRVKSIGKTDEKWFLVEIVDPGEAGENNCQVGTRGWAYGKALLVSQK